MRKIILLIICGTVIFIALVSKPPRDFPKQQFDFQIKRGESISDIADKLYEKKLIYSKNLFKASTLILSFNSGVLAGDYRIVQKENVIALAYRMVTGDQKQKKIRITIPEGTNVADMAFIFMKNLTDFNAPLFVSLAKQYEGYLYPDTYDFLSNTKPEEIVRVMKNNFDKKIKTIEDGIEKFNKPLEDIIIMSSIVEKEASKEEDRRMISGVLWKRIEVGIPLQTDPVFYYITGKLGNVTYDDLKVDSPYNVYKYRGLPIGPISNPSIETIKDVINPISSKNLYYLTGNDGVTRYAETYEKHLSNKDTYLKK